jgi:ubiquitin
METTKKVMEKIEGKPIKERTELFIRIVQNLADTMEVRLEDIQKYSKFCPLCCREFEK